MSYWVSQRSLWAPGEKLKMGMEDLEKVASLGYDHIRLPLDEMILFDNNLNKRDYTFAEVHKIVNKCLELNLNVILDLHTIYSHLFNGPESSNPLFTNSDDQKRLYRMWELLSDEFKHYPVDKVAYEILNEPATVIGIDGKNELEATEKWNAIQRYCYWIIRAREPQRVILMAPDQWQQCHMVRWMWLPDNDPNIIIAIHYYEPMQITHHKIPWSGVGKYKGNVHYPGPVVTAEDLAKRPKAEQEYCKDWTKCVWSRGKIASDIQMAVDVAVKKGLPVYCSEFGVSDNVQMPDRQLWYDDLTNELESRGIGHASWEYIGTWGIISEKTHKVCRFMLPDPNINIKWE